MRNQTRNIPQDCSVLFHNHSFVQTSHLTITKDYTHLSIFFKKNLRLFRNQPAVPQASAGRGADPPPSASPFLSPSRLPLPPASAPPLPRAALFSARRPVRPRSGGVLPSSPGGSGHEAAARCVVVSGGRAPGTLPVAPLHPIRCFYSWCKGAPSHAGIDLVGGSEDGA